MVGVALVVLSLMGAPYDPLWEASDRHLTIRKKKKKKVLTGVGLCWKAERVEHSYHH